MNLYLVVSEQLDGGGSGYYDPPEYYHIAHLVIAKNPSQARYTAWKAGEGDIVCKQKMEEMPRFSCRLRLKNVNGYEFPTIVSENESFGEYWGEEDEQIYPKSV